MVLSVNPSFEWMFDLKADALLGRDIRTLLPQWPDPGGTARPVDDGPADITTRSLDVQATRADGTELPFDIEPFRKECLLNGWDDVGLTLRHADKIREFEDARRTQQPWLFM